MLKHKGEHERETAEEHGVVQSSKVPDGGLKDYYEPYFEHTREKAMYQDTVTGKPVWGPELPYSSYIWKQVSERQCKVD